MAVRKGIICAVVGFGLFTMGASANSVTQTGIFQENQLDWPTLEAATPALHQFDNGLGTLTSVDISLTANLLAHIFLFNESGGVNPVLFDVQAEVDLATPEGGTLAAVLNVHQPYDLQPTGGDGDTVDEGLQSTKTVSFHLSTQSDLAYYIGTGMLNLNGGTPSSSVEVGEGTGNFDSDFSTRASGSVQVVYNYEPIAVPVPSAAWGGLVLLAGMGIWRKAKSFRTIKA